MLRKALLGLALLGVAIAQDLRMPVENAIPSFTPQQQTGSLSELEGKILTVCNSGEIGYYLISREINCPNSCLYTYFISWASGDMLALDRLRCVNDLLRKGTFSVSAYYTSRVGVDIWDKAYFFHIPGVLDAEYLTVEGNTIKACGRGVKMSSFPRRLYYGDWKCRNI